MKNKFLMLVAMFITIFSFGQENKQIQNSEFIGKIFDYTVENLHLNLQIVSNNQVNWTYVSAPNNETGKTAIENCTIKKISKGIYQIFWTEKDGSNVVDIFNLKTKEVFVNFTLPDAKMYNYKVTFKINNK